MIQESGSVASQRSLAVLIDADNAQPSVIEGLLGEVAKFGVANVKRIYGDWTLPNQAQWKAILLKHSINPVQQFAYTKGKNATDCSLIIDAMDLMYTKRFDGFCLVSSDSDFTRLAQRLREEGLSVFGFGERKTPAPFVAACDKFIYTEVLRPDNSIAKQEGTPLGELAQTATTGREPGQYTQSPTSVTKADLVLQQAPTDLLIQAIEDASDETGWALLGVVGNLLNKLRPDFDPRLYGSKKLSDLFRSYPTVFRLEERVPPGAVGKALFVGVIARK